MTISNETGAIVILNSFQDPPKLSRYCDVPPWALNQVQGDDCEYCQVAAAA